MGGVDTKLHKNPMVFADGHMTSRSMHGLTIRKVYFAKAGQYDGTEVTQDNTVKLDITTSHLNSGGVILDSGTTATYFTQRLYNTFNKVFKSEVGVAYHTYGMTLTDAEFDKLPSFVVQLNGYSSSTDKVNDISDPPTHPRLAGKLDPEHPNDVLVVIRPDHYFEYNTKDQKYHPIIYLTEGSGATLGANFMAGHDVLFDISENNRIGFAVSDCSYPGLFNDTLSASTIPPAQSPTTSTMGKLFPQPEKNDGDVCDSFACRISQMSFIAGVALAVLLMLGLMGIAYVRYTQNLGEFSRRKRRGQSQILSLIHPDEEEHELKIDGGIVKGMETREII